LDLSIKMLKSFKKKYKRLPIIKDKETGSIQNAIGRGEWKEQGINTWNDLLRTIFGEINNEMYKYHGNKGFERAIRELKHYKKINGKKPTINIKEMRGICTAIYREEWKEKGVNSWNDLLKVTFGEVNREIKNFGGKKGLANMTRKLKEFKKEFGKLPTSKEIQGYRGPIARGEWKEQGINSWNDLLKVTFGEINREWKKYSGIEGLLSVIRELKEFKKINGKMPTLRNNGTGIYYAIYGGEWKEQGINTWNDLLKFVFGETNRECRREEEAKNLKI